MPDDAPRHALPPDPPPVAYAELHCHSNFSFLDGTSDPESLVERAVELGLTAIALTDSHGLYGVVRFAAAAHARTKRGEPSVQVIIGAELLLDHGERLVLLVRDLTGYRNLCWLMDRAHRRNLAPGDIRNLPEERPHPSPLPLSAQGEGAGRPRG